MQRSESHEGDAILELVADLDNLMLINVKIVRSVIVPRNQLDHLCLDETDGNGQSVHTAFCAVKVDSRNPYRHNLCPLIPNKAHKSFLASTVKRLLAGAEVLQVGVNLANNSMQGESDRPLDGTLLLDGQNTVAARMAGGITFSC
jgi:hypothetical protein